ncbi:MAG: hypothetical protein IJD46_02770, partial [Bacilli bacterium]|nr:hypothetical protein [Bacilli bacterium]
ERHHLTGNIGLGILKGFGIKGGAMASTVGHDSHNLIIAGNNTYLENCLLQKFVKLLLKYISFYFIKKGD